jgi:hypothetical protein
MTIRHAPYEEAADFTIGLKPIAQADWLEGGEADPAARKDPLTAAHRDVVWGETAGSRPGQAEAADLIAAALGTALGGADLPPLLAAARRVPDDLVLMEKTDGQWRVGALSLCAPTFFTAHEVLGRALGDIHGPVHGFADRFLTRVVRIFDGLRPGLVLERRNWSVVNSAETFTPDSAPIRERITTIDPARAGAELFVRVERQTLRRLPATGGALFTIRVWLSPLDDLVGDPPRRAAFARAWRIATSDFRAYKRLELYDELVTGFLRAHGESHSVNGN